jgi:hypothetical protein
MRSFFGVKRVERLHGTSSIVDVRNPLRARPDWSRVLSVAWKLTRAGHGPGSEVRERDIGHGLLFSTVRTNSPLIPCARLCFIVRCFASSRLIANVSNRDRSRRTKIEGVALKAAARSPAARADNPRDDYQATLDAIVSVVRDLEARARTSTGRIGIRERFPLHRTG